jgi:pimeloyl-ACP methyl ester carboxylesterase
VRGADAATGAHRHAVHADTDLSLRGIAGLVSELIDRLDLGDVTVVGNDTGGALVQLLACDGAPRQPDRPRLLRRVRQLPPASSASH